MCIVVLVFDFGIVLLVVLYFGVFFGVIFLKFIVLWSFCLFELRLDI